MTVAQRRGKREDAIADNPCKLGLQITYLCWGQTNGQETAAFF